MATTITATTGAAVTLVGYAGLFTTFSGVTGGFSTSCEYTGAAFSNLTGILASNCGPTCQGQESIGCRFFSFASNETGDTAVGECQLFTAAAAEGPFVAALTNVCGFFGASATPTVTTTTTTSSTATATAATPTAANTNNTASTAAAGAETGTSGMAIGPIIGAAVAAVVVVAAIGVLCCVRSRRRAAEDAKHSGAGTLPFSRDSLFSADDDDVIRKNSSAASDFAYSQQQRHYQHQRLAQPVNSSHVPFEPAVPPPPRVLKHSEYGKFSGDGHGKVNSLAPPTLRVPNDPSANINTRPNY